MGSGPIGQAGPIQAMPELKACLALKEGYEVVLVKFQPDGNPQRPASTSAADRESTWSLDPLKYM